MPETTKPEGLSPEVIREIEEKILGINYEDYFFSYNILYKGENMKKIILFLILIIFTALPTIAARKYYIKIHAIPLIAN